eukprot:1139430-Pelagomonas_calceolata.AAC.4
MTDNATVNKDVGREANALEIKKQARGAAEGQGPVLSIILHPFKPWPNPLKCISNDTNEQHAGKQVRDAGKGQGTVLPIKPWPNQFKPISNDTNTLHFCFNDTNAFHFCLVRNAEPVHAPAQSTMGQVCDAVSAVPLQHGQTPSKKGLPNSFSFLSSSGCSAVWGTHINEDIVPADARQEVQVAGWHATQKSSSQGGIFNAESAFCRPKSCHGALTLFLTHISHLAVAHGGSESQQQPAHKVACPTQTRHQKVATGAKLLSHPAACAGKQKRPNVALGLPAFCAAIYQIPLLDYLMIRWDKTITAKVQMHLLLHMPPRLLTWPQHGMTQLHPVSAERQQIYA